MRLSIISALGVASQVGCSFGQQVINGQVQTPGIAIIDAPQPNTPLGGDYLQIAIEVTFNGRLQLPPYPANAPTAIHNITIFLSSYTTGKNFTITNGTASADNSTFGDIMLQEEGSSVKHINWLWPECLVGDDHSSNSDRGVYNISIRQNFRLNYTEHYTIFDLPINITNAIPEKAGRPSCDSVNNPLLPQALVASTSNTTVVVTTSAVDQKAPSPTATGQQGGASRLSDLGSFWVLVFLGGGLFFSI